MTKKFSHFPKRFFVTGTDTGIGKTFVSAMLTLGLDGCYWKPIQSGIVEGSDKNWIKQVSALPEERFFPESYLLNEPLSPHAAAKIDGVELKLQEINLPDPGNRYLIVEGAGGVMVPINDQSMMLDLMKQLALPVVLVARSALGTINHSVLSINCLRGAGLDIVGVVMNGPANKSNREAIEHYGGVSVIAEIEPVEEISKHTLLKLFNNNFGANK